MRRTKTVEAKAGGSVVRVQTPLAVVLVTAGETDDRGRRVDEVRVLPDTGKVRDGALVTHVMEPVGEETVADLKGALHAAARQAIVRSDRTGDELVVLEATYAKRPGLRPTRHRLYRRPGEYVVYTEHLIEAGERAGQWARLSGDHHLAACDPKAYDKAYAEYRRRVRAEEEQYADEIILLRLEASAGEDVAPTSGEKGEG